MLLKISGEITPERMEGWSQSKNNTQLPLPDGPEAADSLWTSFGAPGGLQASAAPWVRNGGPPTVAELQAQHGDAHNRVFLK